jgi:hypothetical protein
MVKIAHLGFFAEVTLSSPNHNKAGKIYEFSEPSVLPSPVKFELLLIILCFSVSDFCGDEI